MEVYGDFIQWLGADMAIKILLCLDDPSDLVRVSAVSSSWRNFVIGNDLSKHLCQKMFPEISSVAQVIEAKNMVEPVEVRPGLSLEWTYLQRNHKVYSHLSQGLMPVMRKDCISEAIFASSTDNYPDESIQNTLEPSDRVDHRPSYWSSKGEIDPAVPETLIYKLVSKLCVITEIHLQPFQAYFQFGFPIYSAKAMRFHVGHLKTSVDVESGVKSESAAAPVPSDNNFEWTYTSPEFTISQENRLQKFKLPEPVLCIGGFLKVELLGRVQKQEMDGLYYICISHVQVIGRPFTPAFDVEILDSSGNYTLKYYPEKRHFGSPGTTCEGESSSPSRFHRFSESIRSWEQMILNTLLGAGAVVVDDDDSDDDYV